MPISDSADEWEEAKKRVGAEELVIDFLKDHTDEVFSVRELCDGIGLSNWEEAEEVERDRDQMEREEFAKKWDPDSDHAAEVTESVAMDRFLIKIRQLEQMGVIETRQVDIDAFDHYAPHKDQILAVTYSANSN